MHGACGVMARRGSRVRHATPLPPCGRGRAGFHGLPPGPAGHAGRGRWLAAYLPETSTALQVVAAGRQGGGSWASMTASVQQGHGDRTPAPEHRENGEVRTGVSRRAVWDQCMMCAASKAQSASKPASKQASQQASKPASQPTSQPSQQASPASKLPAASPGSKLNCEPAIGIL